MNKKILILLVIFLFLLTSIVGFYLFFRLKQEKSVLIPTGEKISVGERKIPVNPQDPIKKGYLNNGKVIVYDIKGYFKENLKKQDVILEGNFIIEGDTLKREIPAYIGYLDGKTVFGKYEGSFSGKSTWSMVNTEVVLNTMKPKQPVIIRAVFNITGDETTKKYIKDQEDILDTLALEFKNGELGYKIPVGFAIVADRVGIIE